MDLKELSAALPKPWLNIKANSMEAVSFVADSLEAKYITLDDSLAVPNPASGKHVVYVDSLGKLSTNSSLGVAVPYVPVTGATMTGDLDLGNHEVKNVSKLIANSYVLSSNDSNRVPSVRCAYDDGGTVFGATIAESDLIGGTLVGSLTIPAGVAAGFTVKLNSYWLYSAGAATTFTIRLKVNGTTVQTTVIPAAVVVNQEMHSKHFIQVRSAAGNSRIFIGYELQRLGDYPIVRNGLIDAVWDPAGPNTISLTGQFSDLNGDFRSDSLELITSYAS